MWDYPRELIKRMSHVAWWRSLSQVAFPGKPGWDGDACRSVLGSALESSTCARGRGEAGQWCSLNERLFNPRTLKQGRSLELRWRDQAYICSPDQPLGAGCPRRGVSPQMRWLCSWSASYIGLVPQAVSTLHFQQPKDQLGCMSCYTSWTLLSTSSLDELAFSSVQFSRSVVSDSFWPHGLQHVRPPCLSPAPGVHSNSCSVSWWCHPTISSSVIPFSSCLQSFPASGSFQMSQLFT